MRKVAAVVSAVAMLAVAAPTAAQAADAPAHATACADLPAISGDTADLYTVSFCNEDGTGIGATGFAKSQPQKFSVYADGQEANVKVPEGQKFVGWKTKNGTEPVKADAVVYSDMTVYPVFEALPVQNVTVVFYKADDAKLDEVSLKQGTAFSEFAKQAEAKLTVPQGKKLVGWYFAGAEDKTIDPAESVNANGWNVYPKFEDAAKQVTVTFHDAAGFKLYQVTLDQDTLFAKFTEKLQAEAGLPEKDGVKPTGWSTRPNGEGMSLTGDVQIGVSVDVYPIYPTPAKLATVSFYNADQSLVQTVSYEAGTQKFSVYALGIEPTVVPAGKVFAGWAFASNDGDVPVNPDEVVKGDWAVYATFKDAAPAKVNVTFLDKDGNVLANRDGKAGDLFGSFAAPEASAVPGKVFTGWALPDGALAEEGYAVNEDLTVTATYKNVYQPQPQFPWWGNWWNAFQHWWGSWTQWGHGWWW